MSHQPSPNSGGATPRWLAGIAVGLTLISFSLGWWAYQEQGGLSGPDAAFRTLQLFHLHFHDLNEAGDHGSGGHGAVQHIENPIPWTLNIARFGAGSVALGLLPAMLGIGLFRGDLRKLNVKYRWSGHIVVCGHCTRTLSLIKELRTSTGVRKARQVVFIGHCPRPLTELPAGVLYIEGNAQEGHLLRDAAVHRAESLVALNEDDRANLEIVIAAAVLCEKQRSAAEPLACHAHVEDSHLKTGLHKPMHDEFDRHKAIRMRLFNYYEIAARHLACMYPMPDAVVESTPLAEHYVIVGFGSFGQNVALKLVKMGQQLVHDPANATEPWKVVKPQITIVDPRGEYAADAFLRAHPAFKQQCEWSFVPYSCESAQFLDLPFLSAANAKAKVSVVYCLETETVSLRSALLLRELCNTTEKAKDVDAIYLRLAREERLERVVTNLKKAPGKPRLHFFAPDSELFSCDSILHQKLDTLAAYIHALYLQTEKHDALQGNVSTAAGTLWKDLSEENRDQNREAADHIWAKLRTLGYELHYAPDSLTTPPAPDPELLRELKNREEELARAEHCRWMTSKLLNGWKPGPKLSSKAEIAAGIKFHNNIIDYDLLDEPTKDKDRVNIRAIPALLKEGKLIAVKRQNLSEGFT